MGARLNRDSLHSGLNGSGAFPPGRREKGFTMIELLVAMSVASVVAMAGFTLFSQSNWSYQVQESVGEAQQNARVAMDRIVRDIRTAGFGLPDDSYKLDFSVGGTKFETPITVSDNSTGPDTITILGIGYEAGTLVGTNENKKAAQFICYSSTANNEKIIKADKSVNYARRHVSIDGMFFVTLDAAGTSESCGSGGETGIKLPLDSSSQLNGDFKDGTVYIIQAVEYSIVDTNGEIDGCSVANPCLVSEDYSGLRGTGRQLLAENIEDIQFAYGIDKSPKDGVLDSATDCATGTTKALAFACPPSDESSIRAVRVTLSARTRHKDPKGASFTRPEIENHAESGSDNYRRRVLTKVVKVRN